MSAEIWGSLVPIWTTTALVQELAEMIIVRNQSEVLIKCHVYYHCQHQFPKRFLDRSLDLCGPCTHTQTFPLLFNLTSKGERKYFKNEDADISVIVDGVKCEAMHLSRILPAHGETTCNHIFKDLLNFSYLRMSGYCDSENYRKTILINMQKS
ncbi:hypothetical protein MG293_017173 [Ovis ammon polii]|uniref:Uncharacterized protein n=1 Tax=Ovis ammon polii TaxID=230172 RepID=A0AAD4Y059_OVIAM|nr:hypothetical protein MG293_017173 [Ovis ammon polii]